MSNQNAPRWVKGLNHECGKRSCFFWFDSGRKQTSSSTGFSWSSPELFCYTMCLNWEDISRQAFEFQCGDGRHDAGSLCSHCFSWETRQRWHHLHLYYLLDLEHPHEKCVEDWKLVGSHTHTAHSSVNCCSDVSPFIVMISHRFVEALCEV